MHFLERLNTYEKLMRLDKPIGILLLLWPTLWALWIAAHGYPNWIIAWIFVLGTILMRSAGCVINDWADRKFDSQVRRTQDRPLVTGQVSSKEVFFLVSSLCLFAFLLILRLNKLTVLLSLVALLLAFTYPFTKRFLAIPQAYLGIAFGFGIPMAYAATINSVGSIAWMMLAANIFWAIAYDTEYAMVDREDDLKIGIKSSAITFGRFDVLAIMLCYAGFLGLMAFIGWQLKFGLFYYLGLLIATAMTLHQYHSIKTRLPEKCFQAFKDNNWIGMVIFLGIVLQYAIKF